jgi:riboflavin-specific deaminase-like protein
MRASQSASGDILPQSPFDHQSVPTAAEPETLARLGALAGTGARMAVAQLGQSLDGRIATASGHSHYVNGPSAITFLHRLRACVDAVIVGAGTARADDPQLTVRHCPGPNPVRVLVDRRRSAGGRLRMLAGDGVPRIVFGPPHPDDPPGVETLPVPPESSTIPPPAILDALAARGLRRVLVEGGAATVSAFVAAGAIDRLCVVVAPFIIGSGPVGLNLPEIATLHEARRPPVSLTVLPEGDVVFDCDLSA